MYISRDNQHRLEGIGITVIAITAAIVLYWAIKIIFNRQNQVDQNGLNLREIERIPPQQAQRVPNPVPNARLIIQPNQMADQTAMV